MSIGEIHERLAAIVAEWPTPGALFVSRDVMRALKWWLIEKGLRPSRPKEIVYFMDTQLHEDPFLLPNTITRHAPLHRQWEPSHREVL